MNEIAMPSDWGSMKEQANMLVKSGFLPPSVNTPEKAVAIAITSKELGIGMMEGFRSINVIQGKPTISPQLMLALANRTKELKDIQIDATDERCVVTVTRKGRQPHTETFGVKEATALGLMGRDNYNKQRATMFKWRALAANLRVTFPDVMLGFYTPEEMGADVKIGDNEEMQVIVDHRPEINSGVRVPKEYWDLRDTDPEKAQERIGAGFYPKKTEKGYFLFTREGNFDPGTAQAPSVAPAPMPPAPAEERGVDFINLDEQKELFAQIKRRKITMEKFKGHLKSLNIPGTAKIPKDQYPKIMEWIILNGDEPDGQS